MKLLKIIKNTRLFWSGTPASFGYFKFRPCTCGCTKFWGWGYVFGLFGFNVLTKGKR